MQIDRPVEMLRSREGSECIYKEARYVCLARMHSITVDDWGVRAEMIAIPCSVMIAPTEPWTALSIWDNFTCHTDTWRCAMSGLVWRLFFRETLIGNVKEFAHKYPNETAEWDGSRDEWHRRRDLIRCVIGL